MNKGAETTEAFARRVLGDLYERMPILVLGNDERTTVTDDSPLSDDQRKGLFL